MTIGDKIKKIRTFRNMTQAELGAALGWGDKGANRLRIMLLNCSKQKYIHQSSVAVYYYI